MRLIRWLRSLFGNAEPKEAPPSMRAPAPIPPLPAWANDEELVEIDDEGRIWKHGEPAPTQPPVKRSNVLRDPHGEYASA